MNREKLEELLHQALETERGGVQVYTTALACAEHDDLKAEWTHYLEQTRRHEEILVGVFGRAGLDADATSVPCRVVAKQAALSLVKLMTLAQEVDPAGAEIIAAECVVTAETKDNLNWQLLSLAARQVDDGPLRDALIAACAEVEHEEDEHLTHSMGWNRELQIGSLGLPAQLPPADEARTVDERPASAPPEGRARN